MNSKLHTSERGVTLIESVVALGLFTVAAAAIGSLLVGHVRLKGSNLAATTAIVVAERELEDLRALDYADIATRRSTKTVGALTYTVTTTITNDAPAPNMKTIQTQVSWSSPAGRRTMCSTPYTLPSSGERGFSLVELLVASAVMLAAMAGGAAFFVSTRNTIQDQVLQIETTQGLRAAIDSMVRDLRLGGACLPVTGNFIALEAVDGATDQITTRTGLVRPNQTCVRTVLTADVTPTTNPLPVQSASGFRPGMRVTLTTAATLPAKS